MAAERANGKLARRQGGADRTAHAAVAAERAEQQLSMKSACDGSESTRRLIAVLILANATWSSSSDRAFATGW